VVGPLTHAQGVWYATETNFGGKHSRPWRQRSGQRFLVRDASGEALIEPHGMTVRTRHSVTRFSGMSGSRGRSSERMLKEGDAAYVLGELVVVPSSGGACTRHVQMAEDGRRLLVSNYSRDELIRRERLWLWTGTIAFALSVGVMAWVYVQRYHVAGIPGVIR
jgi:hypothetical protein